jgi:hypothetical protein
MPRAAKAKEPTPLSVPDPNPCIKRWVILGLDPSVSRTGFALLDVRPALARTPEESPCSDAIWLAAGSAKPDKIDDPLLDARSTVWIRAKAVALYLREVVKSVAPPKENADPASMGAGKLDGGMLKNSDVGLIISMEYPTPQNDYLWSINRIINLVVFDDSEVTETFGEVRIMLTNASTLRSLMGLTQRGNTNKGENIVKAYEFIDRSRFPQLDSDACDAILLCMMARHAASVMLGTKEEVPGRFMNTLCNAMRETKGKGRNARVRTKGLLHRTEYWYRYERRSYAVAVKDASNPKKNLSRVNFSI